MKNIITILLMLFTLTAYSQTANLNLAVKFQISNPGSTGTFPTFTVAGNVSDDMSRWNATNIAVGDSLYVLNNGQDLAICRVATINSAVSNALNITVTCVTSGVTSLDPGQAAIIRATGTNRLPTQVSGLRADLQSLIFNRFSQLVDKVNIDITNYIGIAGVQPAVAASSYTGQTWRNSVGELYSSNGTIWKAGVFTSNSPTVNQTLEWNGTSWVSVPSAVNSVTPEKFGAKADMRRLTGLSAIKDSKTVTCSACFTNADIGKIITIAYVRIDTAYNIGRRVTMNSKVVAFNSTSSITIDSFIDVTNTNTKGYIGTNNFDAFQTAFEYIDTSISKKTLMLGAGTYLVVPTKGTKQRAGFLGLQTLASIYIKGQGQGVSTIKVGEEFVQRANLTLTNNKRVNGLNIYKDGSQIFEDFTLESADTLSTEFSPGSFGFYTEQRANQIQSIVVNRVSVKGDWGEAFSSSRGGSSTRAYKAVFSNDTLVGKGQVMSYFSQDGANKYLYLDKMIFIGGGQKAADTLAAAVNVSSGSNILTVTTPGFSWYNYYTPNGRNWNVWVNGTSLGAITSITSPTVATVTTNSAVNVTAGQLRTNYATDAVYGHILYIHPNVSVEARDCDYYSGNDINIYSSGGQPGVQGFNRWIRQQMNGSSTIGFYADQTNIATKPFANGGYTYFEDCPKFTSLITINKSVLRGFVTNLVQGDTMKLIDVKTFGRPSGTLDLRSNGFCEVDGASVGTVSLNGTGKYNLAGVSGQLNGGGLLITNASQIQASGCNFMRISSLITTANISTAKLFKFDNCKIGINPYVTTYDNTTFAQSTTYNAAQLETFRQMWSFSNCSWDGGFTSNQSAFVPASFLPVSEGVNNVNGIQTNRSNDIDTLYSLVFSTRGNGLVASTKNPINYLVYGSVNTNIVANFLYNTPFWRGNLLVSCIDTFLINPGINIRTLVSRKREFNEIVTFQFQGDKGILQEVSSTSNNTSIAKPTRTGRVGERVKKSNLDGTEWMYKATINNGTKTKTTAGLTLPVRDTMVNQITLGYEYADRYVSPDTMLSVTIPTSLGTEVFKVDKFGQLVGASGGTGFINPRTKQIKIVTLGASATLNTASTMTVNYKYFSNGAWISTGTGNSGSATLVSGTVTVNTTAVATGSNIIVSCKTPGGTQGFLSVGTVVNGTSFVINSSSALDTSVVNWWIVD